jgi:hypothetical protein
MDDNNTASSVSEDLEVDPVYIHSRREAIFILCLWTCCCLYTVTYCYLNGYLSHNAHPRATGPAVGAVVGELESWNRSLESMSTPLGLGIPDWVFYGIVIPWALCVVITFWFCLFYYVEDDLAAGAEPREAHD